MDYLLSMLYLLFNAKAVINRTVIKLGERSSKVSNIILICLDQTWKICTELISSQKVYNTCNSTAVKCNCGDKEGNNILICILNRNRMNLHSFRFSCIQVVAYISCHRDIVIHIVVIKSNAGFKSSVAVSLANG